MCTLGGRQLRYQLATSEIGEPESGYKHNKQSVRHPCFFFIMSQRLGVNSIVRAFSIQQSHCKNCTTQSKSRQAIQLHTTTTTTHYTKSKARGTNEPSVGTQAIRRPTSRRDPRPSGVPPRACVRVYARVLLPPNLYTYIHTQYMHRHRQYAHYPPPNHRTNRIAHGPTFGICRF